MLTWILGLWANPLARKFIIYGAAGLAIFYAIYRYGTHVGNKMVAEAEDRIARQQETKFKDKEAVLLQQIASERQKYQKGMADNETYRKLLTAREDELLRARHALDTAAAGIEATATASIAAGHVAAQNLDARDAADTITRFARELAADKDWRKRIPARPDQPSP